MAVQFSLSYDANGDPVLVENTVTGTRKVVSTSPVVSEYKSRFETATETDEEENQPDSNQSAIMDYIKEMESGAADNINLSFIEKQNLQSYTPEAIEARSKTEEDKESIRSKVLKTMLNFIPMDSGAKLIQSIAKFLPEESPEIKAIKQFYADPEQAALVESIPGMSDYNLVYGNPFDPSYGLANAAQKRIDTINKTLARQAKKGKQSQVLLDRRDRLQELKDRENKQQDEIRKQKNKDLQNIVTLQDPDPASSTAVSTAGQAGPPSQRGGGGGNGGSSSGGGGCVIATHAVNSGAFTKDTKREAVRWCIKNLHRTWWGEAIRRGYRYYGQKAIEEGKAKNHYQEFKDYVAFGTGKRRTLKTGWTFVYRSIQFFIRGLIND